MGVRLGRTVNITLDDNSVVSLRPGDEVPADLAKHFVSEFEVHRAFATGSDSPAPAIAAAAGEQESGEQGEQQSKGDEYDGLGYPELKALAKERELPQDGKTADLVARLREDDAEKAAGEQESGEQGEQQSGE